MFHLLKAYRENALGWVVSTDVLDSETFLTGWQTGIVTGAAQKNLEMPYIQALGTIPEQSDTVSLFLMNLHPEEDIEVPIHVQGFPRKSEVKALTITGRRLTQTMSPRTARQGIVLGPARGLFVLRAIRSTAGSQDNVAPSPPVLLKAR